MSDPYRRTDDDLAYGEDYSTSRGRSDQQTGTDRGMIGDAFRKIKSKLDDRQKPQQDFGYGSASTGSSSHYYNPSTYSGASTQSSNQPAYVGGPPPQPAYPQGPKQDVAGKVFGMLQSSVHSVGTDVAGLLGTKYDHHGQGTSQGPGLQSNLQTQTGTLTTAHRYESTFPGPRDGNQVKWYVDGCGYMWAVSEALESARESIWILDWWLTPELYLRRPPAANEQWRIDRVLQRAATRGVKVNIIVYKEVTQALTLSSSHTKHALEDLSPNIAVFRHPDHLPDAQTAHSSVVSALQGLKLDAAGASKLGADALKGVYGLSDDVILYWAHHEKLCLVDGQVAFMGGLDLCFGRWDTNQHPIADAHPSDLNKIVFPGQDYNNARVMDFDDVAHPFQNKLDRTKSSRMGWSDVSICLRGPCVGDLRHHFVDRWNFIFDEKYNVRKDQRYTRLAPVGGHSANEMPLAATGVLPQQGTQQGTQQQGQFAPPPQGSTYTPPPWQGTQHPTSTSGLSTYPPQPHGQQATTGQYGSGQQQNFPPPPPGPPPQTSTSQQYSNQPQQTQYQSPAANQPGYSQGYDTHTTSQPQFAPPPTTSTSQQQFSPPPTASQQPTQTSYQYQTGAVELPSQGSPPQQQYQASRGFDPQDEYNQSYGQPYGQDRGYGGQEGAYSSEYGGERGPGGRKPGASPSRFDKYREEAKRYQQEGKYLGTELNKIGDLVEDRLQGKVSEFTGGRFGRPSSRPSSRGGPSMDCQLVRSCTKWSNGTATEHSIQNAYIELIQKAEHFIYIENQFFITATGDKQKPVKNLIGKALVERIVRAGRERQPFKIFVMMPAVPAFAGDLITDEALGTRAIMEFQYNSICRGGNSIMEEVAKAGLNPMYYIRFYNLRNYDRINITPSMQQAQQQTGVSYDDARKQQESKWGSGYGGYGETAGQQYPPPPNASQQYQQAAQQVPNTAADRWDTVSSCYMLGGQDIRTVPWSGPPESELGAFVSEELYIHSKIMIVDDRIVICGSANINDRSMLGYHDSEIALVISDPTTVQSSMNGRPWPASRFASSLRRQIFRKHLGLLLPQDMQRPNDNFMPIHVPNAYDWGSPEDNIVADPLSDTFQSLWNTRARTNTDAFRKAFRAVPDDNVRSWPEYKEFFEFYFAKAEGQAAGKDDNKKPSRVVYGHVVPEDFSGGVKELKELLSKVRGTLVEMPLCFLQSEDIAKEGIGLNALTEELYT